MTELLDSIPPPPLNHSLNIAVQELKAGANASLKVAAKVMFEIGDER